MVTGMVLFALVGHFVMRPSVAADLVDFPAALLRALIGVSLGACCLSLLLRRRVRRRAADESADSFWMTAAGPALVTWAFLDAASLLGILLYALTGSPSGLGVTAVAVVLFVILNPAHLERR